MKAYIVSEGEYDYEHPLAVFTSRSAAEYWLNTEGLRKLFRDNPGSWFDMDHAILQRLEQVESNYCITEVEMDLPGRIEWCTIEATGEQIRAGYPRKMLKRALLPWEIEKES